MSWTDFENEVEESGRPHPLYGCKICKLLREVSPEESEAISAVLSDPMRSTASIYRAFKARGIALDRERVSKHRRGECS